MRVLSNTGMPIVEYSSKDRIGFITLNRPEKRNALSFELIDELKKTFKVAEADPSVKVIVLRANGEVFCAGADLAYLQQLQKYSFEENLADSNHLKDLLLTIYTLKKVVIAQVHGHAIAGGCGLASVCDFILAVPESKFGYTEVRLGFVPALVMTFLIRRLGELRAKELLLSGELISAETAAGIGLINKVVKATELEAEVKKLADMLIASTSSQSLERTKRLIGQLQSMPLEKALELAARENAESRSTEDFKKGISSFLDKTKLTW
jgi:methylglutaconyl-CoA hydratase